MEQNKNMHNMSYKKFSLMMIISFIIMYTVMFLNVIELKHYHTSATRIYMAILMVAPMAVVMMLMMGKMYPNKKINIGITRQQYRCVYCYVDCSAGSKPHWRCSIYESHDTTPFICHFNQ